MKNTLTSLLLSISTLSFAQPAQKKNPLDFVPKGYVVFEKILGDLNKDGTNDCVFIIKGTDKKQIIKDEDRGILDRNRRGIIILFNKNGVYESGIKNYNCFSSENEDGGAYYAPELSVKIQKGKLLIQYAQGRYGAWHYTFRYDNNDFDLIGYDIIYPNDFESDYITSDEESINLLSKKKLTKEVIKVDANGKETYKNTWVDIVLTKRVKLSEIKDFDEFNIDDILKEKTNNTAN